MSRRFDRSRPFTATDPLPYIADTNDSPIELTNLEVEVLVTGLFAQTTQVLQLHNPNTRDLEGSLCFPLPDGAVVCGYAIDVDGQLVDGVVVPKEEARRILEAEIRKGIDPGLIEQVQGNVYRARIYPLPAGRSRTVKIVYISRLTVEGNDAAYHLPLGHAEGVDHVSLRLEVSQAPVQPQLGGLGNVSLAPFESRWVAEAELREGTPVEDLQIRLPNLPDHVTAVEHFGDQDFFCISSKTRSADAPKPWDPVRVAILWDASGSRPNVDRELALLEALCARWKAVTLDVRVVRDVLEPQTHTFEVEAGVCPTLLAFLGELPYDGGTNLAAVDFDELPHPNDEAWLLFTDGLSTVGRGLPRGSSRRVFAITGQAKNDSAWLSHLAQRSGGAHINLLRTAPDAAATTIASWADALRLDHTVGCEDVHVALDGGRFTVVGRLTQDIGSVQLSGPGAPSDHLAVTRGTATTGRNIARAWAGHQAQVQKLIGADVSTIVALGRTYGLVTPGTSLLVLESLDQHLEYDIEPPASRPLLRNDFHDYRRRTRESAEAKEARQIETVVSMWQQRIEWWETDFHALRSKKQREPAAKIAESDFYGGGGGSDGLVAPGGAPAPRSQRAAAPAMMDVMSDEGGDREYASFDDESVDVGEVAKEMGGEPTAQASIRIQPWSPDTPYLHAMKAAGPRAAYDVYLQSRPEFALSPAFFLDCSDFLLANEQHDVGLRVLSNLLELALDDPALLRMYAWRMQQAGELDQAVEVLQRVLQSRDDEPQSHRDLALALEQRWQRDHDPADAVRAMELLYAVIKRTWDRFPEIEIIALMELNRLIHLAGAAGIEPPAEVDPRLIRRLDLDVRISMSWDADLTDVDLHVFEPTGEHAYYGHNRTEIGGLVSRDFREGYGPEEYVLRKSDPGEYTIKTHYYGSHQQTIAGACTVIVTVFTNYARANEQRQVLTLRLERASDQVLVGTIAIAP